MLVPVAEFHIMTNGEWMEMIDVIQDCFALNCSNLFFYITSFVTELFAALKSKMES